MKLKKSDRNRAAYAFGCVKSLKESVLKEYTSYVKSFPVMILQNGLGNAIAFAYAKGKKADNGSYNAWAYLLWHLMNHPGEVKEISDYDKKVKTFIEQDILKASTGQYRKLENETLALFKWLKRFAEGMNTKENTVDKQEQGNG